METQVFKKDQIRAAKLLLFFAIATFLGCSSKTNKNDNYEITIHKSKNDKYTYLNLSSYHYDDKSERYYSTYHINNLIYNNNKLKDFTLGVLPGDFNISAGAVGKLWVDAEKILLKKGDSISIRFYLPDDPSTTDHNH